MNKYSFQLIYIIMALLVCGFAAASKTPPPRIAVTQLLPTGKPKNTIVAIDHPKFLTVQKTTFKNSAIIIGVFLHNQARAYPFKILNWHQVINDKINDTPIAVTLSPLCDTTPVFIRKIKGKTILFDVANKLFQSCLVMIDRGSKTYWIQPWGLGVIGKYTNQSLQRIPAVVTTLGRWKKLHPNTLILSNTATSSRNHPISPFGNHRYNQRIIMKTRNFFKLNTFPKAASYYFWQADKKTPFNNFSGLSFTISKKEIKKLKIKSLPFGGKTLTVIWDQKLDTARFYLNNHEVAGSTAFAFVYPAFFIPYQFPQHKN